jgi:hypothetical protein
MNMKELIETLVDLATFLVIASQDSGEEKTKESDKGMMADNKLISFWEGKEEAYKTAFIKVDKIIKEARE